MAINSPKFSFGMNITTVTTGGNGISAFAHINKYPVDLTGVDFVRLRTHYANANVSMVIQKPLGTTIWQSAYKNSGSTSPYIVTFDKTEIPDQHKVTGAYIGIGYDISRTMEAVTTAPAPYNGMKIYNAVSGGTETYDYTGYTQPIEINYISEVRKYLVQNGTLDNLSPVVYFSGGAWQNIPLKSKDTLLQSDFETYGMDTVPTKSQLDLLTGTIHLLAWSSNANANLTFAIKAVPKDQLIFANSDFSLTNVEKIDWFNAIGSQSGGGQVRLIVSPDSGLTYYGYNGANFVPISIADKNNPSPAEISAVLTNGMTLAQVSSSGIADWSPIFQLANKSKKARWAYLLSMTATTDTAYTDRLEVQADRFGSEMLAKPTEFDVEARNDSLILTWTGSNQQEIRINYAE